MYLYSYFSIFPAIKNKIFRDPIAENAPEHQCCRQIRLSMKDMTLKMFYFFFFNFALSRFHLYIKAPKIVLMLAS